MNFYLTYGYVPWDMCILEGVRKLPQGHALLFERRINRMTAMVLLVFAKSLSSFKSPDTGELVQELKDIFDRRCTATANG